MVFYYDKKKINNNVKHELEKNKFKIIRYNKNAISVYRNNSYIDIMLINFDKKINKYYYSNINYCKYNEKYFKDFKNFKKGYLNGLKFNIHNYAIELIEKTYGKDWRIPQNKHNYGVDAS